MHTTLDELRVKSPMSLVFIFFFRIFWRFRYMILLVLSLTIKFGDLSSSTGLSMSIDNISIIASVDFEELFL